MGVLTFHELMIKKLAHQLQRLNAVDHKKILIQTVLIESNFFLLYRTHQTPLKRDPRDGPQWIDIF